MRVLVVEDEVRLAENVAEALRQASGHAVDVVHDGSEALVVCRTGEYDLIILDLMLPGQIGEEVLTRLRAAHDSTPVLILTAVSETRRTINLLNIGADDYMTKPFDLGELIARCNALIRRGKGAAQPLLHFGNIHLNAGEQTVAHNDVKVELSPTEFRILEYLMYRPRVVVSKRELAEHLYDFTWEHHSNVIEAHISNLRRKLKVSADGADLLETLRGRGYRLAQR